MLDMTTIELEPLAFTTNGLLTVAGQQLQTQIISEPAFAPNGLLDLQLESDSSSLPDGPLTARGTAQLKDDMLADGGFSNNGLLGVGDRDAGSTILKESSDVFISTGLLSGTQKDTFPEMPDILGQHHKEPATSSNLHSRTAGAPLPTHLHRAPVRATTFDGKSIYMKRKTRLQIGGVLRNEQDRAAREKRLGNLLDVPIHRLMDELSAATAAKLDLDHHAALQTNPNVSHPKAKLAKIQETLWVDRYRPHRFTDLLGNERVAREIMAWVKEWDFCVFGKNRNRHRNKVGGAGAPGGDGKEGEEGCGYDKEDEYRRPREKLLLLSGPPGLGKTTMAHVIAKQAGYDVMEINASDARSAQVVDDRIRPALESGSAIGSSKPVLIVIDEIDGATGGGDNSSGFIHKLVQLSFDNKPKNKSQKRTSHKDPNASRPLLRPILCICNDPNASALSKLRPYARQIRLARPADAHVVRRLREVCEREGLRADARALGVLVGVARGDMRGCINALQFIKTRSGEVTESIIRTATAGMKEADSSTNSVLNNLFAPMTRKRVKELGMGEEEESRYVGRLSREVESVNNPGTVATGCFAHYPTLRQHDATFARYEKANEWLGTFDAFSATMYADGDFGLQTYLSYLLVPFYPLFQERGGARIERDQADWENFQLTKTNEEIYKSLSHGLRTASGRQSGDYRHLVGGQVLKLEFAPYINRIISPPLRPVNSQVVKPEERELLSRLVSIMVALELRFVQEKAEDGQLVYRLDPPIDVFVTYDGKRASDIAISRYAVRHLVAAEIDAALIARQADAVEKGKSGKLDMFSKTSKMGPRKDKQDPSEHANKRLPKDEMDIADKPPVDFFGRLITVPSASSAKAAVRKNAEKKYRVTYRYTEGTSAAVRKPVKVGAFL